MNQKAILLPVAITLVLTGCSGPDTRQSESGNNSAIDLSDESSESDSTSLSRNAPSSQQSTNSPKDLRTQEQIAISEHYCKTGQQHYENFRFREAKENLEIAVQANPDNTKARYLLQMAGLLLGEDKPTFQVTANKLADEREVRLQQEKIELRRLYDAGVKLQLAKNYDGAIKKFEQVLERIKWSPYNIDSGDFEDNARKQIIEMRSLKRDADIKRREELENQALLSARREEQRAQLARSRKVEIVIKRATDQIRRKQFSKAEQTLQEVLREDRRNSTALRLRETAIRRRHRYRSSKIAERDREALRRDGENGREVGVPYLGGQ